MQSKSKIQSHRAESAYELCTGFSKKTSDLIQNYHVQNNIPLFSIVWEDWKWWTHSRPLDSFSFPSLRRQCISCPCSLPYKLEDTTNSDNHIVLKEENHKQNYKGNKRLGVPIIPCLVHVIDPPPPPTLPLLFLWLFYLFIFMALDWSRELLVRSWEGNKGRLRQQILFHLNYTNQRNIERMLKKKM